MALVAALCGCASQDDSRPLLTSNKCAAIAQQRMLDAAENGYGSRDQKAIFDGTYADCLRWNKAHRTD